MSESGSPVELPGFVSRQVTEARRFFLNLNASRNLPLEVICGGVEKMQSEYVIDRQDFPYYAIELVTGGEGALILDGLEYRLAAGSVFAYGPGVSHIIRSHPENLMRKYYLDFVGTCGNKLLQETKLKRGANKYTAFAVGGVHELIELFELLLRNGVGSGPVVPAICASLTRLLFLKIQQLSLPQRIAMPKSYATFERIRRYVDEEFLQLRSAQDIALHCEVSPVHLSRLFGRFSDCGAYQYLLRRKMNYAAGLLMEEGLMVKEVALRLGFADPFRFSRCFKRVYGISPNRVNYIDR